MMFTENARNWAGLCALIVPCRYWKSYLPYSKRSENIINRKIRQFYIEAIPPKKSQLRKKIFFRARRKNFEKFSDQKIFENVRQKIWGENLKSQNRFWDLRFPPDFLSDIFEKILVGKFFKFFSSSSKKYFFSELRFFLGIASM